MTEKTIVAAASASSNSPDALAALALIELSLAEPFNARAQSELDELIEGSSGNRVGDFGGFRWAGACRRGLLGGDIPRLSGRMRVAETLGSCC